jgi:hypothetical protein
MKKQNIPDFEDAISKAKEDFFHEFKLMLVLVKKTETNKSQIQDRLTELHFKGVKFFNLFSRSLNEYGIENFKHNENIRNSKIDDSINILNTILKYWKLINSLKEKYQILPPKPSERAYSSIQLFLKTFDKEAAKKLRLKFEELQLPIFGFKTSKTFIDMTKKQQIKFGAITGLALLLILLVIALLVKCPTNFQNNIFIIILSLAGAAFASIIPGLIEVRHRQAITATGAIAVFVIIFFMKPTQLSNYTNCPSEDTISGTLYFGNTPIENIDISIPKEGKSTRSDNFGNFNFSVDLPSIKDKLNLHIQNKAISLDTVYVIDKSNLLESIDIKIKKICVECTQKDSTGIVVNIKTKCSANSNVISDYIKGFTRASEEQGRIAECKRK